MTLVVPSAGFGSLIAQAEEALRSELGGEPLSAPCAEALARLLALVVDWNARVDLTAARDARELVDLYLADAWAVAAASRGDGSWVDVGSGAGAPALGLALLLPEASFTLVEPMQKRVAFLRSAIGTLGLSRVTVRRARSDAVQSHVAELALSRATLPPEQWLAEGTRLATAAVWVLLGRQAPPCQAGWRVDQDLSYALPFTRAGRRAVRFVPT